MPEIWGEESETTAYCSFCPDWKVEGPAHEVREIAREHRAEVHPDLPPPTKRKRANLAKWRSRLSEQDSADVELERTRRLRLLGIKPED